VAAGAAAAGAAATTDRRVQLFGVVNASPDSLNADSIATDETSALARGRRLLSEGCFALDVGGQGSTDIATEVDEGEEWGRLEPVLRALAALQVPVSVDTWRPDVARLALANGATILNAADGLQAPGMLEVAADAGRPVVLPFLNGPHPKALRHVEGDAVEVMLRWFDAMLDRCRAQGIDDVMIDPGTGFAPLGWEWASRFEYQKHVYGNLDKLRVFGLPLYIALPWRDTPDHALLLEMVIDQGAEFGRTHYPAVVQAALRRRAGG
jgi:dihydropteroate synthase